MTSPPSSSAKDIITIVKALQDRGEQVLAGDASLCDYECDVLRVFPDVVQALLIAVEGLEWYSQISPIQVRENVIEHFEVRAQEALDRIRSLPLP